MNNDLCWIHIKDVSTFVYLGANPHERHIGQNIKLDLSLQIPYRGTQDLLTNTVDYGVLIKRIQEFIENLEAINLLEFLAEEILDLIEREFSKIVAARIVILKGYVPLQHFSGSVAIEAERQFHPSASIPQE